MRRATMRDVAQRAGVSLKTVSRVVNVEPGVSPALASRVQQAAAELDYRHNLAARTLRQNHSRTGSFAVLVQDLANGYSAALLRAVDDVARAHDAVMISASLDEEEERERGLVANLINRRVDGLILMPATSDQSYLAAQLEVGFAVVVIDRPPGGLQADTVVTDNVGGGEDATCHLLAAGHRRIAVVTDDQRIPTARERYAGYRGALERAGIAVDPSLVRTARTVEGAAAAVQDLLARPDPPTAVFAARNDVTVGAVTALSRLGLSRRVALVGFDHVPLADVLVPGVTTVEQDAAEVGRRAAVLLLARVAGDSSPPQRVVLPTRLVARGSGELPPPG